MKDPLSAWLTEYPQRDEFSCRNNDYGCEAYHVMAPLLSELGLFRSYETYAPLIAKVMDDVGTGVPEVRILVAGVASEKSACALCDTLSNARSTPKVHFFDRCRTPLRRIDALSASPPGCRVETHVLDIQNSPDGALSAHYDLVLADSFLRQFTPDAKRDVLRTLTKCVRPKVGRIVFREHVGVTAELLATLWDRLATLREAQTWLESLDEQTMSTFRRLLPRVQHYMGQVGGSYAAPDAFLVDLNTAGLRLCDMISSAPDHWVAVSCAMD